MRFIYFQTPIEEDEFSTIQEEFPHYDLIKNCAEQDWEKVEILFGDTLSEEELDSAIHLKWIHCPGSEIDNLPIEAIKKRENIILTQGKGPNARAFAEFVLAAILAFAKNLFFWPSLSHETQEEFYTSPLKESMWSLEKKTLLQIGLGEAGTELVKIASFFGMKTWGIKKQPTFHPYCQKIFSFDQLHSLLPASDVVVLTLPKKDFHPLSFRAKEFNLMKEDSILIVAGSGSYVEEDLVALAKTGNCRGILLDIPPKDFPAPDSPLWHLPGVFLTPNVANFPHIREELIFKIFHKNLRYFTSGKIKEMKNQIIV